MEALREAERSARRAPALAARRVLALAYQFPPWGTAEAIVAAKTLGGLREHGFEVKIVAADPAPLGARRDDSLLDYVDRQFPEVTYLSPSRLLAPSPLVRLLSPLKRFSLFQIPDPMVLVSRQALRALEALEPAGYDALLTRSPFYSAHLAGLVLKRRHPRLRWLVHLSDPWVDNPYLRYDALTRRLNAALERRVLFAADRVTVTSERTRDLILRRYPASLASKVVVIPHPFDSSLYPAVFPPAGRKRLTVRYLGNFYRDRNPAFLLEALRELARDSPELLARVRFEFYGTFYDRLDQYARADGVPRECWRLCEPVSYLESLRLMRDSDALLLIDAPARESVFFPSKLADYLGAYRPILGLTPPGTSSDILRRTGAAVADPRDREAVKAAVRGLLRGLLEGRASSGGAAGFSAHAVRGLMAETLRGMLA